MPFYPPRDLIAGQCGVVNRPNQMTCDLKSRKRFGRPRFPRGLFGREARDQGVVRSSLFFVKERLKEEAHPSPELAVMRLREPELFIGRLSL